MDCSIDYKNIYIRSCVLKMQYNFLCELIMPLICMLIQDDHWFKVIYFRVHLSTSSPVTHFNLLLLTVLILTSLKSYSIGRIINFRRVKAAHLHSTFPVFYKNAKSGQTVAERTKNQLLETFWHGNTHKYIHTCTQRHIRPPHEFTCKSNSCK